MINKISLFGLKFAFPVIMMLLVVFLINKFGNFKINNATITDEKNITRNITLPFSEQSAKNIKYVIKINFENNYLTGNEFHIIADDCIEKFVLNNNVIDLKKIVPLKKFFDWDNGFNVNLKKYLKKGNNILEATITDDKGVKYGMSFSPSNNPSNLFKLMLLIIFTGSMICFIFFILKRLKFNYALILILLTGFIVRLWYFEYTDYNARTYDVLEGGGHLDYIKYLAVHKTIPDPREGWEYHQPPLYYMSAAVVYSVVNAFQLNEPYKYLQFLSLFYFFLFMIFGIMIIQKLNLNNIQEYLIICLFVFWPSGIIHSVRIGNDVLLYLFYVIALYFMIEWIISRENYKFFIAVFAGALAVATKANGIILFGIIGVLILIYCIKIKDLKKIIFLSSVFAFFLLISFSINFAAKIYYAIMLHQNDWLVGDVINTLNRDLFVGNKLFNFTTFNIETFLTIPFTDTWADIGGRQFFWNFLFKTSLFAEFSFNALYQKLFAMLLSFLFLGMLVYMFISYYFKIRKKFDEMKLIHLLNIVFSLAVLIAYRAKIPACCNGDFRYIFPAAISFCYFYGLSLSSKNKAFNNAGIIMAGSFILLSVLFFIDIN